jgi:hypothetical protein
MAARFKNVTKIILNRTRIMEETINDESILLIDGHHGIYIPHLFWTNYKHQLEGFTDEEMAILDKDLRSPDEEHYWEAWEEVLDNGTVVIDKKKYTLYQNDDLWLIPQNSTKEDS